MGTSTQITLIICVTILILAWITRDNKMDGDK